MVLSNPDIITRELKQIGVAKEALSIFRDKARQSIIKFEDLSCAQANVLKQTALICGADLAIPNNVYEGSKKKKIPAILFANQRQLFRIKQRLDEQPWLNRIAQQLKDTLGKKPVPELMIGRKKYLFKRTHIMGVINITPDSFYKGSRFMDRTTVQRLAEQMEKDGADFIDIGAESSRPGAEPLRKKDEVERLKKVLPWVVKNTKIPVSVDTYKADIAAYAIDHGAKLINDISGLTFDKKMPKTIAKNRVGLIIMHIKGTPKTMQRKPHYDDLMGEIYNYLKNKIDIAQENGISANKIIIDPGFGFGKRLRDNYEIAERLEELESLNYPVLAGHSRKSFIGEPFKLSPEERLEGSLGFAALLIKNGASILRTHDVAPTKKVALLIDEVIK